MQTSMEDRTFRRKTEAPERRKTSNDVDSKTTNPSITSQSGNIEKGGFYGKDHKHKDTKGGAQKAAFTNRSY